MNILQWILIYMFWIFFDLFINYRKFLLKFCLDFSWNQNIFYETFLYLFSCNLNLKFNVYSLQFLGFIYVFLLSIHLCVSYDMNWTFNQITVSVSEGKGFQSSLWLNTNWIIKVLLFLVIWLSIDLCFMRRALELWYLLSK